MFTEQPSYSTKPLHGFPAQEQFFHVDLQNEWDFIAEAVIGFDAQPDTKLTQLILLLESHGIIVHRLPVTETSSAAPYDIRSPFVTAPLEDHAQIPTAKVSFFPRDVALVHGTRVIEAPPHSYPQSSLGQDSHEQNTNVLFSQLESAGVEVIRWLPPSGLPDEGNVLNSLVDIEGNQSEYDREEEGPLFCPSDILILSPMFLITRLSAFTNNKGLEYLWSVLSRPMKEETMMRGNGSGDFPLVSRVESLGSARTTTLLVRVTDQSAPIASASASSVSSPRTPAFAVGASKSGVTGYVPLCRVLVPINGNVMLYDPAFIADDEARRLKNVLHRIQEDSRGIEGNDVMDSGGFPIGDRSNSRQGMSYGTFGLANKHDNNWQFISVIGLYLTSILLVSPRLALLSFASFTRIEGESVTTDPAEEALNRVSQVLVSLGVRAVKLPPGDLDPWKSGHGVRDALLVLRRESNLEASADGNGGTSPSAPQQEEEGGGEGCIEVICASLSALLCQSLSSGASEAGASEHD